MVLQGCGIAINLNGWLIQTDFFFLPVVDCSENDDNDECEFLNEPFRCLSKEMGKPFSLESSVS